MARVGKGWGSDRKAAVEHPLPPATRRRHCGGRPTRIYHLPESNRQQHRERSRSRTGGEEDWGQENGAIFLSPIFLSSNPPLIPSAQNQRSAALHILAPSSAKFRADGITRPSVCPAGRRAGHPGPGATPLLRFARLKPMQRRARHESSFPKKSPVFSEQFPVFLQPSPVFSQYIHLCLKQSQELPQHFYVFFQQFH